MLLFMKGLLIGIIIGVPVGPVGALSVRRVLIHGPIYGLTSGLGASVADLVYGSIVAFGLTFISDFLIHYQFWFRLFGGMMILLIGIKIYQSRLQFNDMDAEKENKNVHSHIGAFLSTFLLTISNPTTVVSFLVIFAGFGLKGLDNNYTGALQLIAGVFAGGGLWWILLTYITNKYKARINDHNLKKVNKVFGSIIILFGVSIVLAIKL